MTLYPAGFKQADGVVEHTARAIVTNILDAALVIDPVLALLTVSVTAWGTIQVTCLVFMRTRVVVFSVGRL